MQVRHHSLALSFAASRFAYENLDRLQPIEVRLELFHIRDDISYKLLSRSFRQDNLEQFRLDQSTSGSFFPPFPFR
jgi:hypothetical protein